MSERNTLESNNNKMAKKMDKKNAHAIYKLLETDIKVYSKESPADCPFCGAFDCELQEESQVFHGDFVEVCVIECRVCHGRAPMADTEEYAWQLWNDRKKISPLNPQEH